MIGGLLSGSSWLIISRKSNWAHKRSLFLRLKFFQISRVIQYKVEEIFVILQLALENASNREILILLNKFCLKVQWSCMKNINQLYFSKKKKDPLYSHESTHASSCGFSGPWWSDPRLCSRHLSLHFHFILLTSSPAIVKHSHTHKCTHTHEHISHNPWVTTWPHC